MVHTRKDSAAANSELEPTVKQRRSHRAAGAATVTSAAVVAKAAISDTSKGVAIARNTKAATAAKPLPTRQNVPTQTESKKGASSNNSTIDAVSAVPDALSARRMQWAQRLDFFFWRNFSQLQ
jgi:hypothetical protein